MIFIRGVVRSDVARLGSDGRIFMFVSRSYVVAGMDERILTTSSRSLGSNGVHRIGSEKDHFGSAYRCQRRFTWKVEEKRCGDFA